MDIETQLLLSPIGAHRGAPSLFGTPSLIGRGLELELAATVTEPGGQLVGLSLSIPLDGGNPAPVAFELASLEVVTAGGEVSKNLVYESTTLGKDRRSLAGLRENPVLDVGDMVRAAGRLYLTGGDTARVWAGRIDVHALTRSSQRHFEREAPRSLADRTLRLALPPQETGGFGNQYPYCIPGRAVALLIRPEQAGRVRVQRLTIGGEDVLEPFEVDVDPAELPPERRRLFVTDEPEPPPRYRYPLHTPTYVGSGTIALEVDPEGPACAFALEAITEPLEDYADTWRARHD